MKALNARPYTLDVNSSKGFKWGRAPIRSGFESPVRERVEGPERCSAVHFSGVAGQKQREKGNHSPLHRRMTKQDQDR